MLRGGFVGFGGRSLGNRLGLVGRVFGGIWCRCCCWRSLRGGLGGCGLGVWVMISMTDLSFGLVEEMDEVIVRG